MGKGEQNLVKQKSSAHFHFNFY